jgi:hypothetical protein
MKWMQAVCRNFPGNLQGIIAATAAVVSFDARDAQKGRKMAAKVDTGSNADREPLTGKIVGPWQGRGTTPHRGHGVILTLWWNNFYR